MLKKTRSIPLFFILPFFAFTACIHRPQVEEALPTSQPPKRLLVLVFDQMRPDFVGKFGLKNFQALEKRAIRFPQAYVGHLGSLTVVSHAVMSTGRLPKNLPWRDDLMKDVEGLLGKKGAYYATTELSQNQYFSLLERVKGTSLASQLGETFAIGQKFYSAMVFGGPAANSIITLGPKRKEMMFKGWRAPVGFAVPAAFLEPLGGRFFLDCNESYGAETTLAPIDNRYYPGRDPEHLGGDAWVKDGVLKLIEDSPKWQGIFATFGSVDKVLHMLAEHNGPTSEKWALEKGITLKQTLERADQMLGEILETLRTKNLLNETLIIVTADHGGQRNTSFHGIREAGHLEYGKGENFSDFQIAPALKPLIDTGLVDVSTQDSMIRMWLKKRDRISIARFSDKMRQVPGIAEIYTKQETGKSVHYIRTYRSHELTDRALEWAKTHHQELVETMAAPGSPDVLGVLLDGHGYGLIGEHGGAQEEVQRIPFYVSAANLKDLGSESDFAVRLVDLNPIVGKIMRLNAQPLLDGTSRPIDGYVVE